MRCVANHRGAGARRFSSSNQFSTICMNGVSVSATWRNAYLLGAQELRNGPPAPRRSSVDPDMLHAMAIDSVFDGLGTQVNGARAQATRIVVNWRFTDTGNGWHRRSRMRP